MNIYSYSRVSTDQQTLAQQQQKVSDYLAVKGWTLTADISDEGVSGKVSYKQRNLAKLLDMMEEGDCIICSELSRLSRRMADMSKLIDEELKPRKLRLIIISMGIDLDCSKMRAIDELILNNFAFAAQVERELAVERVNAGHRAKKREIAKEGKFTNRRGELCIGDYAAQYGKRTGTTHSQALEKARSKRSDNMRKKAIENPNNRKFYEYVLVYEERNGRVSPNTDVTRLTEELNRMNFTTSTGLPFNNARTRAMLSNVRKIYTA